MMRKVLVAFSLALAVTLLPSAAIAQRATITHQGEEGEEAQAEEGRRA